MESVIINSKGLKRHLELKIPKEAVDDSFSKNYQKIQKKTKMPGFRQGKVPLQTIKQNYKGDVSKEVLDELFKKHYPTALEQSSLDPVSSPLLIDFKLEEGQEAKLILELEVHPEVKVENYLGLELKRKKVQVTEKQIDTTIKAIQSSYKDYKVDDSLEGPSKKGDSLSARLTGFNSQLNQVFHIDELVFEDLGSNSIQPGFEEQLLGLKKGEEKEFSFPYSSDVLQYFKASSTHEQTLKTKLKLLNFGKVIWPPLDKEFVKKFKVETVEELRAKIKEDLTKNLEQKSREALENDLLEKLAEKNPLELPESLIEEQKERLKENTKKNLEIYNKFSPTDQKAYLKKHKKEFQKEARFSLHLSYLFEKLFEDLKVKLTDEDKEKSLKESFPNKTPKQMEAELKKSNYWNQFLFNLRRKKMISYLLEKSKITEIEEEEPKNKS